MMPKLVKAVLEIQVLFMGFLIGSFQRSSSGFPTVSCIWYVITPTCVPKKKIEQIYTLPSL